MNDLLTLGAWLKQRRSALRLTQHELARQIDCAAVTIRKFESDERRPSIAMATKLADSLVIPAAQRAVFFKVVQGQLSADHLPRLDSLPILAPIAQAISSEPVVPVVATSLVGRVSDIDTLKRMLQQDHTRLVTLLGAPGVGKTRLAFAVIEAVTALFPDGVWFVSLASITTHEQVIATIAQTLDLGRDGPTTERQVMSFLRTKHALLVLDNFEHVVAAAPIVAQLLAVAPQLHVLVTSRETLRLSVEHRYLVSPLAVPAAQQSWTLADLQNYAAVRLFIERMEAAIGAHDLTSEDATAIAAICRRLDGLPLAIELVAARTTMFSPTALLARLDSRLTLLTNGPRDMPVRQQTLLTTIGWSYDLLTPHEQHIFRQLGVFVGGWTIEAATAVCGEDLIETLTQLIDKSLIVRQQNAFEPRFTMFETIHAFALEVGTQQPSVEEARRRHASYYAEMAVQTWWEVRRDSMPTWINRLRDEHTNMRAAMQWSLSPAGDLSCGLRLVSGLWPAWMLTTNVSEGRQWLVQMLEATPHLETLERAVALYGLGMLTAFQGDHTSAYGFYTQSLELSLQLGERKCEAWALIGLGRVAWFQGDHERAIEHYQASLATFRSLDEDWGMAQALDYLGDAAWQHNQNETALERYRACLAMYRSSGDIWNATRILGVLASIVTFMCDYEQATLFYEECMELCRRYGNMRGMVSTLLTQGTAFWLQGRYDWASNLLLERLDLCRNLNDSLGVADSFYRLGDVARDQGDLERATDLLNESVRLFRELDDQGRAAWALKSLGEVAFFQGEDARAVVICEESLGVLQALGDLWGTAVVRVTLGRALYRLGNRAQALHHLETSLTVARRLTFGQAAAWALTSLGDITCDMGNLVQARQYYLESLPLYQDRGEIPGFIRCLEGLALILSKQGALQEAARLWGAAAGQREAIGAARPPSEEAQYEAAVAAARSRLGAKMFDQCWQTGRCLTLDVVLHDIVPLTSPSADSEYEA